MIRSEDILLRRFINNIDIRENDECWSWTAGSSLSGYGQFRIGKRKVRVHRVAYLIRHGQLPRYNNEGKELIVCHTCDNKICCNPDHLFLGTHKENTMDAFRKNRRAPGESNPNVVLKEEQVWQIRLMLFKKISHRKIAKCFNVSKSAITHISTGTSWSCQLDEPTKVRLEV